MTDARRGGSIFPGDGIPTPGTSGRCRGLPYTRGMEWDASKVRADTLLPDDPRLHIGTITADKVSAGTLDLGAALTEEQLAYLRRAVTKGSS